MQQQQNFGNNPHGSKGMVIVNQDTLFESPKRHSASGVSTAFINTSQAESGNYRSKAQWNSTDWN